MLLWNAICLIPIATNMAKKILFGRRYLSSFIKTNTRTSFYLLKIRWKDHLVSYFSLMYRYEINTIPLHLTFSRAEFQLFLIKSLSLLEFLMKKEMNQPYMYYYIETSQYFTNKNQPLYFKYKKKLKTCRNSMQNFVNSCLQMTGI